jgi:hypothetical protein
VSRPAPPEYPPAAADVLADLERRLSSVETFVGIPTTSAQPPRRPAPQPRPEPSPAPRSSADRRPNVGRESRIAPIAMNPPRWSAGLGAADRDVDPAAPTAPRSSSPSSRSASDRDPAPSTAAAPGPSGLPPAARRTIDEAIVGRRLLAWAGGAAQLVALGTLFWLGVRDGVITETWRCVLGAVASVGLLAAGLRNARNGVAKEASWAMAGTGLGGLYATGAVATATYDLLPDVLGLPLLAVLGVASALLALRWEAPPLAGVGLLGALGAPVIAPVDGLVLPVVVVAMAATGVLLRHRPWTWLAAAATVLALPQVGWHVGTLLDDLQEIGPGLGSLGGGEPGVWTVAAPGIATVAALAAGLAMVAGWEIRAPRDRERWSMPLLLVVHAAVAAALGGSYALVDQPVAAVATLVASAALLGGAALRVRGRADATSSVELVLFSTAVLVLDLGFAIAASGLLQLVGWAVTAVAFALLARHASRTRMPVLIGGLGLHAGLALIETVGASGGSDGTFLAACAVLAGVCAVSGRVIAPVSEDARVLLDVSALGVALWWTAATLPADQLALVLAAEAVALLLVDRRSRDLVARGVGLTSLAIAAAVALMHGDAVAIQASWGVVPDGELGSIVLPLLAVAVAAGVAVATLRGVLVMTVPPLDGGARTEVELDESVRGGLAALAGTSALLAASVLAGFLTDAMGGGTDAAAVVRDVLWASTGLGLLAAGLVRAEAPVRIVGLSLLAGIGGKIALIDLADVDTAGRVIAWAVLGALLLVGAGLYARIKPEVEARHDGTPDDDLRVAATPDRDDADARAVQAERWNGRTATSTRPAPTRAAGAEREADR